MIVLGALPIVAWLLLWIRVAASTGWREALMGAAVIWGVLIAVSTEGLSVVDQLRFGPVVGVWSVVTIGAAAGVFRRHPDTCHVPKMTWTLAVGALPFFAVLAITLLVALVAPPNTWDSMTYHMARVAHWVYQGSVNDYPTESLRQLYQPPWAEFAIAQFQILTGGDHMANLVQWSCMAASLVGVSLIAGEIGASTRGQYLAALLAATLPMGILQASSTQNDYVEAFWMVCAVFYALRLRVDARRSVVFGLGASIGLAVLTKGTAYIFALPVLVAGAWWLWRRDGLSAWKPAALVAILFLALNASIWARNASTFGSILGPPQPYTNQTFSAQAFASNILRDASAQIGTPVATVNNQIARAISGANRILGIDVNDPRTTWPGVGFQVNLLRPDEDSTPDPVQFVLLLVVAVICLVYLRRMRSPALYLGGLVTAFLVFAFVLRWQPWHSRLELPLMVLAAPFTAAVISIRWPSRAMMGSIVVLLLLTSVPWLLGPSIRPLLGPQSILTIPRSDIYFLGRPDLQASYQEAADHARSLGCRVVGIDGTEDSWEYPLWVYLGAGYRVVPVHPASGTERLGSPNPTACLVLSAP